MDKEKALKVLIANVYCMESTLSCPECPLYIEDEAVDNCIGFEDDDLVEAVKVLNERNE